MNLPGKYASLLLLAQPHRIDPELGQYQRLIDSEVVQPCDISPECRLVMKIDVETNEIGELDRQIFGRRKVGIADQRAGMLLSDTCDEAPDKPAHRLGTVPANDVGRDFVADKIPEDSGMAPAIAHSRGDRPSNLILRRNT